MFAVILTHQPLTTTWSSNEMPFYPISAKPDANLLLQSRIYICFLCVLVALQHHTQHWTTLFSSLMSVSVPEPPSFTFLLSHTLFLSASQQPPTQIYSRTGIYRKKWWSLSLVARRIPLGIKVCTWSIWGKNILPSQENIKGLLWENNGGGWGGRESSIWQENVLLLSICTHEQQR